MTNISYRMFLLSLLLVSLVALTSAVENAVVHCDGRGGCDCDCSWANPSTCGKDDGSCCFACCCGNAPPPPPPSHNTYCPSANDIETAYGSPNIYNGGWSVTSGGAAATKASFNLLGGGVEFDIDFSGTHQGVNANIYTISPNIAGGQFNPKTEYCDGAKPAGSEWCVEVDWIESNGGCGGQTTLHTRPGPGTNGCTAWGCANDYQYNGRNKFHMAIYYDTAGHWTTVRDGQVISPSSLNPAPQDQDWSTLQQYYNSRGALIYSSQWVGWVPVQSCGGNGNLDGSYFAVSNLRINGTVVKGPEPARC